jgi:hypothetical protein
MATPQVTSKQISADTHDKTSADATPQSSPLPP